MNNLTQAFFGTRIDNALERYLFQYHNIRWNPNEQTINEFIRSNKSVLMEHLTYDRILKLKNMGKKSARILCEYLEIPATTDSKSAKWILIESMKYHEYDDGIPKRDVYKALRLMGCTKEELRKTGYGG